eukprot:CAMPEP_0170851978 /NCGR_PEP_ID=MMETSP0734-20130129/11579_1 /TAXON_ID=186038 /ORGANISM="Fragilariopsis kerguelensis, Strain L26-C5" /LENGTH=356 /DNA_ID=CAMNT_0011222249 /DNA_START=160 /DNA_END=1227 /DNA_ORIENTATION=+
MSDDFRTAVSVSPGIERGPSVNIHYSYSRPASILLQRINWNDIDSIKKYYRELPRTLKKIPNHLLGISTEFSAVDKTIKWFSGLNGTDQQKQAEYWKALPQLMKDLYKNNINVLIKQQKILNKENKSAASAATVAAAAATTAEATAAAASTPKPTKKRGRPLGSINKNPAKKINTVSLSPIPNLTAATVAERPVTPSGNNELNGTSLVPSSEALLESSVSATTTTTTPSSELVTTTTAAAATSVAAASAAASASASASESESESKSVLAGTKKNEVPFGCMTGQTKKKGKTKQRQYVKWENHPDILQAHVDARKNQQQVPLTTYPRYPPRTTINDYVKRLNKHEEATGEKLSVAEW